MESNEHLISEGVKVPDVNKVEKNDKLTLKVNSDTQKPKESDRNELIDKDQDQLIADEKTNDAKVENEKEKKAEIEKQKKVEADKQKKIDEEKKKEDEKKKKEEEKQKEEKKKEEEKKKKEEEKKIKEEKKKKEDEDKKKKAEEDQKKKEEEKKKKEDEKKKKEEEKKKKEEEKKKKEEEEKAKKEELAFLAQKMKFPIKPYKVSKSHSGKLLAALAKGKNLRPKVLLCPETDDITATIDLLDDKEEDQYKREEAEDKNFENNDKEDKIFQDNCKESSIQGNNDISDPMALFAGAEKVYIDQFYKLSDLFVICPLYFNYRISLQYSSSDDTAYHLFNTKEVSPLCSHNICANQAREIDINIFNFIVDPKNPLKTVQKFVTLKKGCRCAFGCFCACCSRPTFSVKTLSEEVGYIVEAMGCDPVIQVLDINKDLVYEVKTKYSDCGFCLRDQCCDARKCAKCQFIIYDKDKKSVGVLTKDHRSGKKVKPDYDQLTVVFPPDASCQEKVLLTCSALVIEYLYFQHMTNHKRCCGNPRFINSYQTY